MFILGPNTYQYLLNDCLILGFFYYKYLRIKCISSHASFDMYAHSRHCENIDLYTVVMAATLVWMICILEGL